MDARQKLNLTNQAVNQERENRAKFDAMGPLEKAQKAGILPQGQAGKEQFDKMSYRPEGDIECQDTGRRSRGAADV